jgi:hypothetical protein
MKHEILTVLYAPKSNPQSPFESVHIKGSTSFARNQEVRKIYNSLVTDFRNMLAKLTFTESRTYTMISYPKMQGHTYVLFEFICVMCCFRLYVEEYVFALEFDTDTEICKVIGEKTYEQMMRQVYRVTNYECTQHDLEDAITINTALSDHYSYFKMVIKDDGNPDALIAIEDGIFE